MSRYRFALRPWWIVSHLFVAALVVAMVSAGFWQLSRMQEKKDRNARVAARSTLPVADVASLVEPGDYDAADDLEFRRVEATGRYLADEEVIVRGRSYEGAPGSWVLTPLDLGDGVAVTVNRGWIPNSGDLRAVPEEHRAPEGEVTVTGLVRETERRGRIGGVDPSGERLTELARADVERLDEQVSADLLPLYVQLADQVPPVEDAGTMRVVPAPALDEGPHLSYAVQWFIFTTVALVGYPLILRRRAREAGREAAVADAGPADEGRSGDAPAPTVDAAR